MALTDSAVPVPDGLPKDDARIIGLVALAHGVSHFFHLILAPLFPWLKEDFGVSYAELGFLMTMFFVVSGIGQVLAGFVVDRIGAPKVLYFGMACLTVSALVLASANSYAMLLAGSMLAGAGNSIFHPSDFTLLNRRVSPARMGHAFSLHGLSGNLGWAAAPVFLVAVAGIGGWRFALAAAALVPVAVLALLLMNHRYLDYQVSQVNQDGQGSAGKLALAGARTAEHAAAFLRLPAVWMCFAFFLISAMALGAVQSFSSTALRTLYGMPLVWATTGYTAFMVASAVGTFWGGIIASKTDRHERTIAMAFIGAATLACVIATGFPSAMMAVVLMGAIGFGSGIAGPSRDMMIRAASPSNATGRVYGVVYSGLDIGLAAAPLLFGALMDAGHPAWIFLGIGFFQASAVLTAVSIGGRTARLRSSVKAAPG